MKILLDKPRPKEKMTVCKLTKYCKVWDEFQKYGCIFFHSDVAWVEGVKNHECPMPYEIIAEHLEEYEKGNEGDE